MAADIPSGVAIAASVVDPAIGATIAQTLESIEAEPGNSSVACGSKDAINFCMLLKSLAMVDSRILRFQFSWRRAATSDALVTFDTIPMFGNAEAKVDLLLASSVDCCLGRSGGIGAKAADVESLSLEEPSDEKSLSE